MNLSIGACDREKAAGYGFSLFRTNFQFWEEFWHGVTFLCGLLPAGATFDAQLRKACLQFLNC